MKRFLILLSLAVSALAHGEEKATDPMSEQSEFRIAPGFTIELFSADPSIAKPIQMNFDSLGRLWVACSESYPQLEPGAPPRDKIYILEDRDRDGFADHSTVFAEGLRIPTGIEIDGNSAYVGDSTELVRLSDTDGDGKADRREIVLTAFGTEDTHHLIHTFRWSPWGNLYFAQAVYIHSHVETPWGVRRLEGGGFWEFDSKRHKLDVFCTGMTNSWGLAFDEFGQAFGVDNDQYSVNFFPPGSHLIRTPNESHIFPSLVDGKPKYCGAEFVASAHFPDDWQGNLITCDFRAHRLCRYKITDKGAGFAAEELPELLSTPSVSFRPVDAKFGPDGALYICDWYNPIINHGEVDFRDPRRDKTHGRIWRIRRSDRPAKVASVPADLSVEELVDAQSAADGFLRHFARRELRSRDSHEVAGALKRWTDRQTEEINRLRSLWTYEVLGEGNEALTRKLLTAGDFRIRSAAVRALSRRDFPDAHDLIQRALADEHPRVRTEGVRALQVRFPGELSLALTSLDKGSDPVLEYALRLFAREERSKWLPIETKRSFAGQPADRWIPMLLALESTEAVPALLEFWKAGKVQDESAVLSFFGTHGAPDHLALLVDVTRDRNRPPQLRALILSSLGEAFRRRQAQPSGDLAGAVHEWLSDPDPAVVREAVRLAGLWRVAQERDRLAELARDERLGEQRKWAIDALRQIGGAESTAAVAAIFDDAAQPAGLRSAALASLVALDPADAAGRVIPILESPEPSPLATEIVASFLTTQQGPNVLAEQLTGKRIPQGLAEESIKRVNASGQVLPGLMAALRLAGGMPAAERNFSAEQIQSLARQALASGNPHHGKEIYERKELACATCHVIRGTGGRVGPDLTSIGASAPIDYLVESLLMPSSKIKENYHSLIIVTDEGQVVTGIPEQQSDEEITLRLANNTTTKVSKNAIDESKPGGSLMPTDVVDRLPTQDLLDLTRYLAELGKPGPFGPAEEQAARHWKLIGPVSAERAEALTASILKGDLIEDEWRDSLTTNDAWVYVREYALSPDLPVLFASTQVEVDRPAQVRLTLQPGPKASYWMDGKPLEVQQVGSEESTAVVELEKGSHTLLVKVDLSKTPVVVKLRGFPITEGAALKLEQP